MSRGSKAGFTLIEALVAVVLLGVGVVGVLGAYGAMTRTQANLQDRERMQRLALQKFQELVGTGEYRASSLSGDFADWNEDRYTWSAVVAPTGVESLETLQLTVQRRGGGAGQVQVEGAVFVPPVATGGATP